MRENANRKIIGFIQKLRHDLKGKLVLIGILGCMASDKKEELLAKRNLGIDFIAWCRRKNQHAKTRPYASKA